MNGVLRFHPQERMSAQSFHDGVGRILKIKSKVLEKSIPLNVEYISKRSFVDINRAIADDNSSFSSARKMLESGELYMDEKGDMILNL